VNLSIEVHQSIHEFEQLKTDWNNLIGASEERTFFLSWQWLYTWWSHFSHQGTLHLLVLKDANFQICGIAPFYIKHGSSFSSLRVLTFLGSAPISSDFLDIICLPSHKELVAKELANYFFQNASQWDSIKLCDTLESSICATLLERDLLNRDFKASAASIQTCPYLTLPATTDELLSTLSSRLKNTIKRKLKKAEKADIVFSTQTSGDEIEPQMHALFELHQKRWQSQDHLGSFAKADIRAFHLDSASTNIPNDNLILFTLKQSGYTIATLYAFKHNEKIYYYQSGFDPDYSEFSPGTILMWKAIEHSISNGLRCFDFLRGDEGYKSLWTTTQRITKSTYFYRPFAIKMTLWLLCFNLKSRAKQALKSLISR